MGNVFPLYIAGEHDLCEPTLQIIIKFHSELAFLYGYASIFQVTLININNQVKNAQYTHLRRTFKTWQKDLMPC